MKRTVTSILFSFMVLVSWGQTKVSGYVFDDTDLPIPFANVIFKNSTEGTITDENGRFYLESSETHETLIVSFIGFETLEVPLAGKVNYDLRFVLKEEASTLDEVVIVRGKQPKKNNPAIDLLRKIWEYKRKNGLEQFDQYRYDKYEKVEFDINTVDSALIRSKLFRGMEFVFEYVDTSSVTGKTYLPMFINEAASEVYGDNLMNKEKEVLLGNKNSGFSDNQV
ncbi:MAG: carboxypeptidase-like regulatory domain-containing protein, partial [Bacteroidia bacterium]|nr:carboxypeptidase-like regulatory domain-containing protein [Bacteroidia bacterium]